MLSRDIQFEFGLDKCRLHKGHNIIDLHAQAMKEADFHKCLRSLRKTHTRIGDFKGVLCPNSCDVESYFRNRISRERIN